MSDDHLALIPSLETLFSEFYRRSILINTNKRLLRHYRYIIRRLNDFMVRVGVDDYSAEIGEQFLHSPETAHISNPQRSSYSTLVYHLNVTIEKDAFWPCYFNLRNYTLKNKFLITVKNAFHFFMTKFKIINKTQKYIFHTIELLDLYLLDHGIANYSPDIGIRFLESVSKKNRTEEMFHFYYTKTIERIDSYFYGILPVWQINGDYQKYAFEHHELQEILAATINRLTQYEYGSPVIKGLYSTIILLDYFMTVNNIDHYDVEIGEKYIRWMSLRIDRKRKNRDVREVSYIMHFNDTFQNIPFSRYHRKIKITCPDEFQHILNVFIEFCQDKGNKSNTLNYHREILCHFFSFLKEHGCKSVIDLNSELILSFCGQVNQNQYGTIKQFLRFCSSNDYINRDFSYLVPKKKKHILIPPYYTKEERMSLEAAVDRSTSLGKRNYAIILLLNRLGLRSSDVVNLRFSNIGETIRIKQYKTDEFLELPLLDNIREAIDDYVANGRPASDDDHVFLMYYAPHCPITSIAIHGIVTKYMKLANIDINGRKHGGHALRASLGTDLINNGMSYEETRKIYGHKSDNVIKHYASLDVNRLRLCALPASMPTGYFCTWIESGGMAG